MDLLRATDIFASVFLVFIFKFLVAIPEPREVHTSNSAWKQKRAPGSGRLHSLGDSQRQQQQKKQWNPKSHCLNICAKKKYLRQGEKHIFWRAYAAG